MNYKAMIKKQSTIILVAVICLTIVTIGASYALFFQVETNSNNQVVTAGSLDISYGSGSSSITATELVPMSDDEALTTSTMTGTIYVENKGSLPANYEIAIGNDTDSFNARENALETDKLLSHEYIRVAAYKNGELVVEPTTLSDLTASEHDSELYKLFNGFLDTTGTGNSTMTIVLKIWIAENAPESIIGDYVYLKMDVTSIVDETTPVFSDTSSLTLTSSLGHELADYKIYGNSIQDGDPSPTNPVEVQSVGDYDSETGKYKIPVTVSGKNIIPYPYVETTKNINGVNWTDNGDGTITIDGTVIEGPTGNVSTFIFTRTKPTALVDGKNYVISGGNNDIAFMIYYLDENGNEKWATDKINWKDSYTFQMIYAQINLGKSTNNFVLKPQIEEGSTASEYEPYQKPTTTNIYLDEPLRKIGEYQDYIDFANQTITRKVASTNFVSSYISSKSASSSDSLLIALLTTSSPFGKAKTSKNYGGYNTIGAISYLAATEQISVPYWAYNVNSTTFFGIQTAYLINDGYEATLDGVKAWVDAQNNKSPIYIDYVLADSDVKPIELPKILTTKGTAILSVDTEIAPSKIEVSYR